MISSSSSSSSKSISAKSALRRPMSSGCRTGTVAGREVGVGVGVAMEVDDDDVGKKAT